MHWPVLIAGLTLGLVSSLHCVGMCGPLALALPVHHLPRAGRFFALLFYQLGRVLTYSFLGLLVGEAGRKIYLAGFQQTFSLVMGGIVLLLLILYYGYKYAIQPALLSRFFNYLQKIMMRLLRSDKNIASFLLLGIANGFLPCGMVYVAIATALTTSSTTHSVLFMAFFGLGTIPAMLALSYFGQMISLRVRIRLRRLVPVFMGLVGLALVLRGLNLDIPYLSPELPTATGINAVHCHR
ncbi:MAG: sulfite exporter TauE/SafE family protein [Chitinophagaceae bacterium]|jgi:sulfite exporter TauE/SafE|nr:sulfite exporter TauE/SafE family protein [Chitinophagaceae bacterium]